MGHGRKFWSPATSQTSFSQILSEMEEDVRVTAVLLRGVMHFVTAEVTWEQKA